MRRNTLLQVGLLVAGVALAGTIIVTIWLGWVGGIGNNTASLVIGGIGAFASAMLAIATYTTVLQNRYTVEELQIDREKPLVEDELNELVVPFKTQLERQISEMHERDSTWVRITDAYGRKMGCTFYQELPIGEISGVVLRKVGKDNPALLSHIKSYNQSTYELEDEIESIVSSLDEDIRDFVEQNHHSEALLEPERIRTLSKCTVQGHLDRTPAQHVKIFWDRNKDELRDILGQDAIEKLNGMKAEYRSECQSLRQDLIDYQVELQQKYGISEQELTE